MKMLKQLRIRLTLLYLFASIILSLAVGGGTYTLVNYYFRTTNDQALWVKMGLQFGSFGIPLPLDLYEAVKQEGLVITNPVDSSEDGEVDSIFEEHHEGLQEGELADIYVLALSQDGTLVSGFETQISSQMINTGAVSAAEQNGYDLRTIKNLDGVSIRLLTYLVPKGENVAVIQIGRYLSEQQRVLRQLLNAMILLGGMVTILFGLASWIMAGRTIKPSQQAWDKQQTFVANASHELRAPLDLDPCRGGIEFTARQRHLSKRESFLMCCLMPTT
jgi:hypothetical protein